MKSTGAKAFISARYTAARAFVEGKVTEAKTAVHTKIDCTKVKATSSYFDVKTVVAKKVSELYHL